MAKNKSFEMKNKSKNVKNIFVLTAIYLSVLEAFAVTSIKDDLTGASTTKWLPLGDACLTAGDGSGSVPKCRADQYDRDGSTGKLDSELNPKRPVKQVDPVGSGVLRLTRSEYQRSGGILSKFTFPMNAGLETTFTSYSWYGGNNPADGFSFFLFDGTKKLPTKMGAIGGSLGYTCANVKGDSSFALTDGYSGGIAHGYFGLGIDSFGNFSNNANLLQPHHVGDNTSTGLNLTSDYSRVTNTIGLRGAGNVNWANLSTTWPQYYPSSLTVGKNCTIMANNKSTSQVSCAAASVAKTCQTGTLWDFSDQNNPVNTGVAIPNYNWITHKTMPVNTPLSSGLAKTREEAKPINYKIQITREGNLSFYYSYNNGNYQPVVVNQPIVEFSGKPPAELGFGFGASTAGNYSNHEIACFKANPLLSNTSASVNAIQTAQVKTDSQIFISNYNPTYWLGSVAAVPLVVVNNKLTASKTSTWDANCVLTGGACESMGVSDKGVPLKTIEVQDPESRNLMVGTTSGGFGGMGTAFRWDNLSSKQKLNLNSLDGYGPDRLNWLRGHRTGEEMKGGQMRDRFGVVGDIINSSPTWVGPPISKALPNFYKDFLYPNTSGRETSYEAYVAENINRQHLLFSGSNDGWLHAFRSGTPDENGKLINNDGREVFAFMPKGVSEKSSLVSLTKQNYGHNYFVDATPATYDVFYGNAWHTWIVGGVGSEGRDIYALDITDQSKLTEKFAGTVVRGNWEGGTIGLDNLGNTVGTPIIARLHNGRWALIFGNGLGSGKEAGVYIGLIDPDNGRISSFSFLNTKIGNNSDEINGIAYVSSADLDKDGIVDYLYAGDQTGRIWRFDLTSKDTRDWHVSKFGRSGPTPLFVARTDDFQPITTSIAISSKTTISGEKRVILNFGTGEMTPRTKTSDQTFKSGQQSFYGIWDWGMKEWNNGTRTNNGVTIPASNTKYAALNPTQYISRAKLMPQFISSESNLGDGNGIEGYRTMRTDGDVCWAGSGVDCNQFGWYFDFPSTGSNSYEQIVYNPVIFGDTVVVNTAIPPIISANLCNPGVQTGWSMAFNIENGGGMKMGLFQDVKGSYSQDASGSTVVGVKTNGVGTPFFVNHANNSYMITQTINNNPLVIPPLSNARNSKPVRTSWREIVKN